MKKYFGKSLRIRELVIGMFMGALIFSGTVYAASASTIQVHFSALTFFFDGVEKKLPEGQKSFIYNGHTYVPLRFAAESLGKEIGWDSDSQSVYVGEQIQGAVTYLDEMQVFSADDEETNADNIDNSFETVRGNMYHHGLEISNYSNLEGYMNRTYRLNEEYDRFEAYVSASHYHRGEEKKEDVGSFAIYTDGNKVYESGPIASHGESVKIELSVQGAEEIRVEGRGVAVGLLDAKLIKDEKE